MRVITVAVMVCSVYFSACTRAGFTPRADGAGQGDADRGARDVGSADLSGDRFHGDRLRGDRYTRDQTADHWPSDRNASDRNTSDLGVSDGAPPHDVLSQHDAGCVPSWRCGNWTLESPELMLELSTSYSDSSPVLSSDCLTMYIASDRPGGLGQNDIWAATRTQRDGAFSALVHQPAFSSAENEYGALLSPNGLEAIVQSTRPGGSGKSDFWMATRTSTSESFGPFAPLSALNSAEDEYNPFFSPDGLRLYFTSSESGVAQSDIYMSERSSLSATFANRVPLTELNTATSEASPSLTPDELVIVFGRVDASDRTIEAAWYAVRATRSEPFGAPQQVPVINSPSWNQNFMLACGGEELWFVSNRNNPPPLSTNPNMLDIFRARFVALPQ